MVLGAKDKLKMSISILQKTQVTGKEMTGSRNAIRKSKVSSTRVVYYSSSTRSSPSRNDDVQSVSSGCGHLSVDVGDDALSRHGADCIGEEESRDGGGRRGTQTRHGQQQFTETRLLVSSYQPNVLKQ